jgi:aerobic-type carbon monoxide dehydrogenase small subunit (CoxS/CutS family)
MAEEKVNKISRREFLKDAGLVIGGATIGSMAVIGGCGGDTATTTVTKTGTVTSTKTVSGGTSTVTVTSPPVTKIVEVAPAVSTINITVNDKPYEVQVEANWTLQEMLRQKLGFLSPKDMCNGYGACGSCTVIMNKRPVLSCMVLAIQCDGAEIETAEGLAETKHPLIDAAVKHHAMQCGYCTPGFLITSKALLDRNPNPTEEDIREALASNICFCGTYPAHAKTIFEAAQNL